MWALSKFKVTSILLAVLPLPLHVCIFPTTYILQSSESQNVTHSACWDHYQQLAKNAKDKNFFSEWHLSYSNTIFSDWPPPCLAETEASLPTGTVLNAPLLYLESKTQSCAFFLLNYQIPQLFVRHTISCLIISELLLPSSLLPDQLSSLITFFLTV